MSDFIRVDGIDLSVKTVQVRVFSCLGEEWIIFWGLLGTSWWWVFACGITLIGHGIYEITGPIVAKISM